MTLKIQQMVAGLGFAAMSVTAYAAPVISLNSIDAGTAGFDKFASANGPGASVDRLSGLADGTTKIDRVGYNITRGDGVSDLFLGNVAGMNGQSFSIDPAVNPVGADPTEPVNFRDSGLRFTFDTSINYFGVEIGDWGTCCFPSRLYMQVDDGPAMLLGTATQRGVANDPSGNRYNFGTELVFASVLLDGGKFNRVYIWGDGLDVNTGDAERLLAGGAVRFANVTVQPPNPTPLPGTLALLLAGLGLMAGLRRRAA